MIAPADALRAEPGPCGPRNTLTPSTSKIVPSWSPGALVDVVLVDRDREVALALKSLRPTPRMKNDGVVAPELTISRFGVERGDVLDALRAQRLEVGRGELLDGGRDLRLDAGDRDP